MENNQQYVESENSELHGINESEGDGDVSGAEWMDEYFNTCPEGYKFLPTDEDSLELLVKKDNNEPLPLEDVDLYNLYLANPISLFNVHNEEEAYYLTKPYSPEQEVGDTNGYWKATDEADVHIISNGHLVGYRKTLDFYSGSGRKTDWKMHEFRLDKTGTPSDPQEGADAQKLEAYVICKVFKEVESEENDEQNDAEQVMSAYHGT